MQRNPDVTTTVDSPSPASPADGADARAERSGLGLSAKLLILTTLFVMLAEVLIFLPSVANFRVNWLNDRLTAARLASLAAEGVPGGAVPDALRMDLLNTAQVRAVAIKRDEQRRVVLPPDSELAIDQTFDLRMDMGGGLLSGLRDRLGAIGDALGVFVAPKGRIIRVIGRPAAAGALGPGGFVEIVLPEAPLKTAMVRFALNILGLSIIISLFTAALVYLALNQLLVQPMMRIARSMLRFGQSPEDASRIITPSARTDELGTAERELAHMQRELNQLLHQKTRLAQLGLAVSKINHDLRNMLSSAQLISDRLRQLPDPTVQRFTPKLMASLDRAIAFCNATLKFGRAEEAEPRREKVALAALLGDVGDGLALPRERLAYVVKADPHLVVDADRDQLYRVLNNLVRNAAQAIETQGATTSGRIEVDGVRRDGRVLITVADNGPGIPERARAHLFEPFQSSTRLGGSGLGLAIARELVEAHGGRLSLRQSGRSSGTTFEIAIPDGEVKEAVGSGQ